MTSDFGRRKYGQKGIKKIVDPKSLGKKGRLQCPEEVGAPAIITIHDRSTSGKLLKGETRFASVEKEENHRHKNGGGETKT